MVRKSGLPIADCRLPIASRQSQHGLSFAEAMLSLAITSMLLVAVATAFNASANVVILNDGFFRCSQAARVSMNQMLGEIRNCDTMLVDNHSPPDTTWMKISRPAPLSGATLNQLYVLAPNESYRMFRFDSANQRITLQITYQDGTTSPLYELASNVSSCVFGPVGAADWGTDYAGSIPVRVPITMTVSTGGNSVVLNGSASPRRAVQY